MKLISFLDLFAGCGGLSEGFVRQGFRPVAHIEIDAAACNTLKTRQVYHWLRENNSIELYYKYLKNEITRDELYGLAPPNIIDAVINSEISENTVHDLFLSVEKRLDGNQLDLIIGGPPCQAYSLVGRSRDKNRMLTDSRNYLYRFYAQFLKRFQPKYFIFENVTGLLSAKDVNGKKHIDTMKEVFFTYGYTTEHRVLSANDYNVPQLRKRVILIGKRCSPDGFFPEIPKNQWDGTVWDVLGDLPKINAGKGKWKDIGKTPPLTQHISRRNSERDLEIYRYVVLKWDKNNERVNYDDLPEHLKTHRNRMVFKDRFKVVAGNNKFSHTIVAHLSKDGHYYIHPDINQNRSLTPREAARLQTFPDDFFFESKGINPSFSAAFRQIGNAVPVKLSEAIASAIKDDMHED
ncbi:MAG: DNA cytosine methyltransferase [Candidatus Cloacimonetes bacterium]|nr:DNA cytosine methyltransferase [Candidatus Cloacimonadota bacterium]